MSLEIGVESELRSARYNYDEIALKRVGISGRFTALLIWTQDAPRGLRRRATSVELSSTGERELLLSHSDLIHYVDKLDVLAL
jgi:hypothetical protein